MLKSDYCGTNLCNDTFSGLGDPRCRGTGLGRGQGLGFLNCSGFGRGSSPVCKEGITGFGSGHGSGGCGSVTSGSGNSSACGNSDWDGCGSGGNFD